MDELSVKIKIADREYPMKVKRKDEEKVRAAGKIINEKLKHYRDQFGIDDKQDRGGKGKSPQPTRGPGSLNRTSRILSFPSVAEWPFRVFDNT
jgi:hypothetical protein